MRLFSLFSIITIATADYNKPCKRNQQCDQENNLICATWLVKDENGEDDRMFKCINKANCGRIMGGEEAVACLDPGDEFDIANYEANRSSDLTNIVRRQFDVSSTDKIAEDTDFDLVQALPVLVGAVGSL